MECKLILLQWLPYQLHQTRSRALLFPIVNHRSGAGKERYPYPVVHDIFCNWKFWGLYDDCLDYSVWLRCPENRRYTSGARRFLHTRRLKEPGCPQQASLSLPCLPAMCSTKSELQILVLWLKISAIDNQLGYRSPSRTIFVSSIILLYFTADASHFLGSGLYLVAVITNSHPNKFIYYFHKWCILQCCQY